MKSDNGAMLTKIAAIINFVVSGIILLAGIIFSLVIGYIPEANNSELSNQVVSFIIIALAVLISFIIFLLGWLLLSASRKMRDKKTVKNGAIWAIVIGAITLGNVSGIFALIGGILALVDADK